MMKMYFQAKGTATCFTFFFLILESLLTGAHGNDAESTRLIEPIVLGHRMIEGSDFQLQVTALINELSKRTKIDFELLWLPSVRSLISANDGTVGGDISRVRGLSNNPKYPNLRIVDAPWAEDTLVALAKNDDIELLGWESIKNYRVCFRKGTVFVERKMEALGINGTSHYKLMQSLIHISLDRCDLLIYWIGHFGPEEVEFMNKNNIDNVFEFETMKGYLFLNEKYQDILPFIKQALINMSKDGTRNKIMQSYRTKVR